MPKVVCAAWNINGQAGLSIIKALLIAQTLRDHEVSLCYLMEVWPWQLGAVMGALHSQGTDAGWVVLARSWPDSVLIAREDVSHVVSVTPDDQGRDMPQTWRFWRRPLSAMITSLGRQRVVAFHHVWPFTQLGFIRGREYVAMRTWLRNEPGRHFIMGDLNPCDAYDESVIRSMPGTICGWARGFHHDGTPLYTANDSHTLALDWVLSNERTRESGSAYAVAAPLANEVEISDHPMVIAVFHD
jgi:hypothetical protein